MPTTIEDIYTALSTLVETQLPAYVRLPNPYALTENTFLHLDNGYAIAIGPGNETARYLSCHSTYQRDFGIALVTKVLTTQNNMDARELIETGLLISHDTLRKEIYKDTTLGGLCITAAVASDSGIQFIDGDRLKFLAIELTVSVEYQDIIV